MPGPPAGPRSGSRNASSGPPSPIADGFALTGPSALPDPQFHAYRQDLADAALAGQVIASHYAEPLLRHLIAAATLHLHPDDQSQTIAALHPGDALLMLDNSRGWAWGYAGPDRRVGYIRADAVGI